MGVPLEITGRSLPVTLPTDKEAGSQVRTWGASLCGEGHWKLVDAITNYSH